MTTGLNGEIAIRDGLPSDAETIAGFNAAMALETENLELDRGRLLAGVRGVFEDPNRGRYFIAEADGGLAVAQTMITYEWSDWRNAHWWWIQSVYVRPEWRRKGVFRKIYLHARDRARENGAAGLRLYVETHNRTAHETYLNMGMTQSHYQMYEEGF